MAKAGKRGRPPKKAPPPVIDTTAAPVDEDSQESSYESPTYDPEEDDELADFEPANPLKMPSSWEEFCSRRINRIVLRILIEVRHSESENFESYDQLRLNVPTPKGRQSRSRPTAALPEWWQPRIPMLWDKAVTFVGDEGFGSAELRLCIYWYRSGDGVEQCDRTRAGGHITWESGFPRRVAKAKSRTPSADPELMKMIVEYHRLAMESAKQTMEMAEGFNKAVGGLIGEFTRLCNLNAFAQDLVKQVGEHVFRAREKEADAETARAHDEEVTKRWEKTVDRFAPIVDGAAGIFVQAQMKAAQKKAAEEAKKKAAEEAKKKASEEVKKNDQA